MDVKPQYTVLRIKRKATEPPLSSLVIQDPASDPNSRVKKRRDVSGRPRGVFRLAETVPPTWQGKGDEAEALKTRIKGLLQVKDMEDEEMEMNNASPGPSIPKPSSPITRTDAGPSNPAPVSTTQYRVIPPISPRSRLMLPPKVYSHKDAETGALVFVDAAAVEAAQAREEASRTKVPETTEEEDKEMAAFQSMLQEYLSLEKPSLAEPAIETPKESESKELEDGYVYDLYYRDARASPTRMGVGDGVTPNSIGALIGYEDFSPPGTPSDSEVEDEADEDSNDEDFYRNDYPEDEDADSDMEDLEARDGGWSSDDDGNGDDDDEEERGNWDYR